MKNSILSQGYAMVPVALLEDSALTNYSLRAYIAISSDWAKMGHSRVLLRDMVDVSGWTVKTCQRALCGLSRYAQFFDTSGNKLKATEIEEALTAGEVIVVPKVSFVKARTKGPRNEEIEATKFPNLRYYYYIYASIYNNNNIYNTSIYSTIYNNKSPEKEDTQKQTHHNIEAKKIQEELSTSNTLPEKYGKNWLQRVVAVYSQLWLSTYGQLPKGLNYARVGSSLKPLKENFSEYQLALMLIQYFQWYGADGSDEFAHNRLRQNAFPLLWFPGYVDAITVALGKVLDDEKKVKQLVDAKLSV